jgi:hypothetical protein
MPPLPSVAAFASHHGLSTGGVWHDRMGLDRILDSAPVGQQEGDKPCAPAILFLAVLLPFATPSWATVYTVLPDRTGNFPTIQAGVDAIVDGDVLELGSGTFSGAGNRDVDYPGKAITIRSPSGNPMTCIIDCAATDVDPRRAFHFHSGEPDGTALAGVTITRGWMSDEVLGGGICCENGSSPVLANCILTEIRGAARRRP